MKTKFKILAILSIGMISLLCIYVLNNKSYTTKELIFTKNIDNSQIITTRTSFIDLKQSYSNLSSNEKNLIDVFLGNNLEVVNYLKDDYDAGEGYREEIKLREYDDKFAILFIPILKGGYKIEKYNIRDKTTETISNIFVFGNIIQSNTYEIYINDNGLKYLKFGDFDFKDIASSSLEKNETYTKQAGYGDIYEGDISGNILNISVFRSSNSNDVNKKLREVEYVLP